MIGTILAHYRITGELGAGGMGEVWRATDEKLGREVALKVLSEEFSDNAERLDRFEREARAVASLNHPHIVTIFSVEDVDGIRFLTMELVEGRTLDKMIPETGFDAETFFNLATPLAEAISAAHDKSVIHRDLKPSNVMVDGDDRVKVMDFGLAKLQDSGEVSDSSELPTEALTGVGMVVGTVPYMSPEQIEGKIVDHRTDVFSLGVLLYEMATGERPFSGESSAGLMSSILRDAPAPVGERRDDLPNHLGRIISRCLEKDRRDRYQTARDVFNELKALRRESNSMVAQSLRPAALPPRPAPRPSSSSSEVMRSDVPWIAVLPFACPSGEENVEAFADGLEEDIASSLSRFSYLFVVARKSTGRYRGEAIDVRQVGEELGARFVMEGGIRKAGSTIRINVQIVDTETGTHLWSKTYDRDLDETAIFAIQDDITDRVVATVADPYGVVARSMAIPTAEMKPKEMTAYQAVLRYFLYQQRLSQEDHLIARESLERAVQMEPGYADAWSCLALAVLDEDRHDFNRRPDALDRALSAARRGMESDPASSFAHYALATVHFYRRDLGAFRANAETAIKLNRRNGNVVAMLGILYGYSGDWNRGVELTTEAMELNPHHPGWYRFTTFFDHYLKGEFEEALRVAQKINMPGYYAAPMVELLAHRRLGNTAGAENAADEMLRAYPADDMREYGRFAEMWFYSQPDLLNQVISDLRSVGVEVDTPETLRPDTPSPVGLASRVPSAEQVSPPEESESVAIAVLPFSDLSPAKDQDYFCEGMAEEIMNALVQVDGIRVASRTSAFRAFEDGGDLQAIRCALGVGQVLEGSVRMAGNRMRVTAQLTEAETGYQLWSERYDREAADVFAVQDEIAVGVVEAVTSRLTPGERKVREREQVVNLEAYRSYLLGQHLRYAKEDHGGAVRAFQEAVRLDPTHAPSWTGLAESLSLSAHMSLIPAHEACKGARKALSTAMELQGESADGLHGEAFVAFIERRWKDLEAAVRRAIELQPSHVPSLGLLGMCLCLHQKPDEAEPFFERARQADPLASFPYMLTALGLLTVGRPQEAHGYAEQALTFEKDDASALFCSSLANIALGHFEEGIAAAEHGVAVSHRGGDFLGLLGWALASAGREDEARTLLEELRARPAAAPPIVSEGWLLGELGEIDTAFEVLVRAENENQLWLYYTGLPGFDPLRADPRFDQMVDRLGLPPSPSAQRSSASVDAHEIADKSIAVLPFVNRSGNPDDEFFSDGLSEELINALNRVPDLKVAARSSAFQFRGQELDVRDVGRRLGVATVLEGSVKISGSRLRITTELVNCANGYQIWSERFDREMTDIFETQDEIVRAIVTKLHVELGGSTEEPLVIGGTENMEAYRLYLKGRHLRGKEDHEGALRAFEEAIHLDPSHAPSWTGLAEINVLAAHFSLIPAREGCAAARKALATANALQRESAEGLHVEGFLAFIEQRWTAMETAWRRAIELEPNHVLALGAFGLSLCTRQRLDEALPFLERARQADPLASIPYARTAAGFLTNGRPEEALRYAQDGLTVEKEDVTALLVSCMAQVALGRTEEGISQAERAVDLSRRGGVFLGILGWALATAGRDGEARAILEELRTRPAGSPTVVSEAWLLGALGEIDEAFKVLARAEEECQGFLNYTGMPGFDPLRADPRFVALEERFGLRPSPSAQPMSPSVEEGEMTDKSIAVLPFVNMSADRDNEYFSDGLSEEIINALTRLPGLRVIARTSAFRFRGEQDLRKVGETLGVRNVLEGSVRRSGERLRITAQLIDAADESHIWSERFDRELTDVFEIQDEIAGAIVKKLHVSIGAAEPARRQTENVAAYEALLEARHHFSQFTPIAAERALDCLQRALSLEPDYPDALVMHAFYHLMMAYMFADPRDALPNVRALAERALQCDPYHGEAQAAVAVMAVFWDRDWSASENLFRRALELSPASARVHELNGLCCLLGQGRFQESLAELDRAIELDPLSALYAGNRGRVLTCARRFAEAEESCRRGLAIDPGQLLAQVELTYALLFDGRFEEAIAIAERAIETHGLVNAPRQALALSYALAGRRDEAFELVNETAEPDAGYRSPLALGLVHAAFSEMDEAFACIEQSFEERDPLLIYLSVHPMFDTLRGDPRYPDLLERMNLSEGVTP